MHQLKVGVNCHVPWILESGKKDTAQIFQSNSILGQDPYVPFTNLKHFFSDYKSRKASRSHSSRSTQYPLALLDGSTAGYQRGSGKGLSLVNAGRQLRHYSVFEKSEILNAETRISRSRSALSGDLETLTGIGIKHTCFPACSPPLVFSHQVQSGQKWRSLLHLLHCLPHLSCACYQLLQLPELMQQFLLLFLKCILAPSFRLNAADHNCSLKVLHSVLAQVSAKEE